jgi:hypothetical protein
VTFIKIRSHRRKFSNSDSVEQKKKDFRIVQNGTVKWLLIMPGVTRFHSITEYYWLHLTFVGVGKLGESVCICIVFRTASTGCINKNLICSSMWYHNMPQSDKNQMYIFEFHKTLDIRPFIDTLYLSMYFDPIMSIVKIIFCHKSFFVQLRQLF